ncbi:50S ribosomal protein L35 [Candidatus Berkelbacteria bacterium]|nr:50S ribosomal protein L35 [Candidatus Berkelbacteria bacterium]MBI2588420.1 50S ribosomal protein L35 [Candidatus Berkelbacteria bacterium]MBI4029842.1 50S ribosomal protein L35 [Candidatus Berkelbacteria bacterium]
MKTSKSAAKRMKITKTGKVFRLQESAQHLARKKSKRRLKLAGRKSQVAAADIKRLKRLMPYL